MGWPKVELRVSSPRMTSIWIQTGARRSCGLRASGSSFRNPDAVAEALRDVPRSQPFAELTELAQLDVPALVVASGDQADPGHPYATAELWAQALPQGQLISEGEGESPLAWQGGRLSREIASFAEQPEVAERLCASA